MSIAGKYLTFALGEEEYGLPVLKVREIIKVIPVVDLRLKFGFASQDYTERTCIIVVEVALAASRVMMGMVVDSVSEVLNIGESEIEETPEFGERVTTDYIKAMAKVKGRVKILLDLDRVLGAEGTIALQAA